MISILLPHLRIGGAERVNLNLAYEFKRKGLRVEIVLVQAEGELLSEAQRNFKVINLKCQRLRSLPKNLINYISKNKPDTLLVSIWPLTIIAPIVNKFTKHSCKVIICEHNHLSKQYSNWGFAHRLYMQLSMIFGYRFANERIGVSRGVIEDISKLSFLSKEKFNLIYNPVKLSVLPTKKKIKFAEDLWSCPNGARILSVGNLTEQKNNELLLRSFAKLDIPDARLMFVGDGEKRELIISLAKKLRIHDKVILAGFQSDPTPFYKTTNIFVLSSNYEGLPLVLVEALSCGTPIVSTNCPSGPAEILDNGIFGKLVPIGDVKALAKAIKKELNSKSDSDFLIKRSSEFLPKVVAERYLKLINK